MANPKKIGDAGEERAVAYLQAAGFDILETKFRCVFGEIDIIARKADQIHFVEVKNFLTTAYYTPLHAITKRKQRTMLKVAKIYLLQNPFPDHYYWFDAFTIQRENGETELEFHECIFEVN